MGIRGGGCRMTGRRSIVHISLGVLLIALLALVAGCNGDEELSTEEPAASPVATDTVPRVTSDATASDAVAEPTPMMPDFRASGSTGGAVGDNAPEFSGINQWLNSDELTMEGLRGDVVLIDFWTYTCVNCIRTMPFLRDWNEKYADRGLTMIGVHTPEFAQVRSRCTTRGRAARLARTTIPRRARYTAAGSAMHPPTGCTSRTRSTTTRRA
ncbi:MAG: redoxin family protein [Chloroflexi bacterium]|nr:redoxin family protein [Chloroflexota bacterium]